MKIFLWPAVMIVVVACSGSKPTASSTLYVGLSDPPTTLDPRFASDANSMRICDLIFQALVGISRDLKIIPEAAAKWTVSKTEISFTLRPGLKFQNGQAVTLKDITNSIVEYKKPSCPFSSRLEDIESVSALEPNIVVLKLKKGDASLLTSLAALKILPQSELERSTFGRDPIGSGSFSFQNWNNQELTLTRFLPSLTSNIKNVSFKFVRDENTRYLKIIKGELDLLINELQEDKVAELKKSNQVQVLVTQGLNFNYLLLNLRDSKLSQFKIRKALFAAIDREPIIEYKLANLATLATSLLSPVNPFAAQGLDKYLPRENLFEGRQALAALSDRDRNFSLKTSDQATENGQVIAENFRSKLGLHINHESFEWATYFSDVKAGRFQLALMRWVGLFEPDIYRDVLATSEFAPQGHNRGFYSNKKFDNVVALARYENNFEKRENFYTKAQVMIAEDLPILPLWYNANISILSRRVKNFKPSTNGSFSPLIEASKE